MSCVIAAIDGSPLAQAVQDGAIWAANTLQLPIKFVHALEKEIAAHADNYSGAIGLGAREHLHESLATQDNQHSRMAYEAGQALLQAAQAYAIEQQVAKTSIEQRHGELIETLQYYAPKGQLMVLGRKGEGHAQDEEHQLGAHLDNALRNLSCPLLITVEPFRAPTSFMIAYDGRDTATQLLDFVVKQPLLKKLDAHIVMVGDKPMVKNNVLQQAKTLLTANGFNAQAAVIKHDNGTIADTLLAYQAQHGIDMLAMGAFATKGLRRFFVGTNTTKVIAKTTVPVLVMK